MKEYDSLLAISDQILEMEPNSIKNLFFRGKAFLEIQDYDKGVDCFKKIIHIDPNH